MRLVTLVLALVIISALLIYNKNSLFPGTTDSHQTVKEQAKQIIDNAKSAASELQKQTEQQQKRLEQFSK
jgi:hypothetical protein